MTVLLVKNFVNIVLQLTLQLIRVITISGNINTKKFRNNELARRKPIAIAVHRCLMLLFPLLVFCLLTYSRQEANKKRELNSKA